MKLTQVRTSTSPKIRTCWIFNSQLSSVLSPEVYNYSSGFPTWCWLLWRLLIQETVIFLHLPASLPSFGGSDLIYDLSPQTNLK